MHGFEYDPKIYFTILVGFRRWQSVQVRVKVYLLVSFWRMEAKDQFWSEGKENGSQGVAVEAQGAPKLVKILKCQ